MSANSFLDQIVHEIIDDMSLKEKVSIANFKEKEIHFFHDLYDSLVGDHLGQNGEIERGIIHRIWEVLRKTHRIRRLK